MEKKVSQHYHEKTSSHICLENINTINDTAKQEVKELQPREQNEEKSPHICLESINTLNDNANREVKETQIRDQNEEESSNISLEHSNTLKNKTNQVVKESQLRENKLTSDSSNCKVNEEKCCIFCLEPNNLIHVCSCNVMAHKSCAIEYITYPGSQNDKCCMCRKKLEYNNEKGKTTIKLKYRIILTTIIISMLLLSAISMYVHLLFIPVKDWNMFLYVCAIGNLSMSYPLMIMVAIGFIIDYHSPRSNMADSFCYCRQEDVPFLNYHNWRGDRGVGFGVLILLALLLIMTCVVLAGIYYISYGTMKFYRSFELKSKRDIYFQLERPVSNIDINEPRF